jgi:hypothetical protein
MQFFSGEAKSAFEIGIVQGGAAFIHHFDLHSNLVAAQRG